jgi:hypothetical protein
MEIEWGEVGYGGLGTGFRVERMSGRILEFLSVGLYCPEYEIAMQ